MRLLRAAGPRLAVLPLLAACAGEPSGPPRDPLPAVSTVAVVDSLGPIVRSLSVELDAPGRIEAFYQPAGGGRVFRVRADSAAARHELLLPRLYADTGYAWTVRTFDGARASDSVVRGELTTGPLPAGLADLDYTVEGEGTFELMLLPQSVAGFAGQVGMEPDGAIVWYAETTARPLAATPVPGSDDVVFIDNGRDGIVRLAPDGGVVAFLPREGGPYGRIHHDVAVTGAGRVLFIARHDEVVGGTLVTGEAIWDWDPSTGSVEMKWSSFDALDWTTDRTEASAPDNWLHANSISIGPRGNILLSLRRLHQVISIAPDFGSLEWRLGGPNATHALSDDDRFVGQHSAWELPGDRVLLLDNGGGGEPDAYSRGLELRLVGDTTDLVWQYAADPPIHAGSQSGIYRMATGHSLVTFSSLSLTVDEVDAAGNRVWRLSGAELDRAFRAVPWTSIAGEVRVDAMP